MKHVDDKLKLRQRLPCIDLPTQATRQLPAELVSPEAGSLFTAIAEDIPPGLLDPAELTVPPLPRRDV